MAKTRRVFKLEFKREAVRQATQPGSNIASFSRDLGVHESVLRRWIQELSCYSDKSLSEVTGSDDQSREIARMRQQVTQRRITRETVASALRSFCTPPFDASGRNDAG